MSRLNIRSGKRSCFLFDSILYIIKAASILPVILLFLGFIPTTWNDAATLVTWYIGLFNAYLLYRTLTEQIRETHFRETRDGTIYLMKVLDLNTEHINDNNLIEAIDILNKRDERPFTNDINDFLYVLLIILKDIQEARLCCNNCKLKEKYSDLARMVLVSRPSLVREFLVLYRSSNENFNQILYDFNM